METRLTLKTWKMDYSFIIKNYLDKSLWEKTWTLFEYKYFTIQLELDQIQVRDEKIRFVIRCVYHNPDAGDYMNKWTDDVYYSLKLNDVSFLKRAINSAIYNCICGIERCYFIRQTDRYMELDELYDKEQDTLRNIAEEFLDSVGVDSEACRDAYIEAYIDENSKFGDIKDEYEDGRKFMELTDFWLIWINSLEDEKRKDQWLERIHNQLSEEDWQKAYNEAIEYAKYMETEEFQEEMKSNLEEV